MRKSSFNVNTHSYFFKFIISCVQQVQAAISSSNSQVVVATSGTAAQAKYWTLKL